MKKRRLVKIRPFEFAARFSIVYAIFSLVTLVLGMTTVYELVRLSQFQLVREAVMTIAISAADELDVAAHETLRRPDQEDSPAYQEIAKHLQHVVAANPNVASVYTMRPSTDLNQWSFVVDSSEPEDLNEDGYVDLEEDRAHLGESYDTSQLPELRNSLSGPSADREITSDKWGEWISGYAPLHTADGATVGIVGVDFSAAHYLVTIDEFRKDILLASAVIFLLSVLFVFLGAHLFHKQDFRVRQALLTKAEELDRLVKKRTEALEEFSAMIVHELRAPLTAQRWTAESLLNEKRLSRTELNEALTSILSASSGMLGIINNFLDASKIDVGKFTLNLKKDDPIKVIKSVIGEFSSQAAQAGIDLSLKFDGRVLRMMIDSGRLAQLVRNLVSNALKYTQVGYVSVTVRNNPVNRTLRVEITDTGAGISKKDQQELFKPFIRLTKGTVGSGLGLSIAKGIVEAHHGTIGFESVKGRGSTFWFELPKK